MQQENKKFIIKIEVRKLNLDYALIKNNNLNVIGLKTSSLLDDERLNLLVFNIFINESGRAIEKFILKEYFEDDVFKNSVNQNYNYGYRASATPSISIESHEKNEFEKIIIDKIRKDIFDDIINDIENLNPIKIEINSDYHLVFDFWWEDLFSSSEKMKEVPIYVVRNYLLNKDSKKIESNIAMFFFSRARNSEQESLISSVKEELLDFYKNLLDAGVDVKQALSIKSFNLSFLNSYSFDNLVKGFDYYIVHVSGHGSKNGSIALEGEDLEASSISVDNVDKKSFSEKFIDKNIEILNLSFCYSCYNDNSEEKSLPILISECENNIKYIISSKTRIKPNQFNNFFYNKLLGSKKDGEDIVENSFFEAVQKIDANYKKSFSLFKLSCNE